MTLFTISRLLCLATLTLAYDSPPSIQEQPEDIIMDTRVSQIIKCRATGIPEPTYQWHKNGSFYDIDANPRASLDGGNLVITDPDSSDNGKYQCFATNKLGTALSDKVTATLAFLDQFKDSQPSRIAVDHGKPLSLRCGTNYGPPDGAPNPNIYWTDASAKPEPIEYNARVNQDQDGNLVFSNVNASDARGYFCTAMNLVIGESKRSPRIDVTVNVDVQAVPIPASLAAHPAANVIAIRTETLNLKCIAQGYPTPTHTWTRNGDQLLSGDRVAIDIAGQELTITNVEYDDAGSYMCEATNSAGRDAATTIVTVESAPYFPDSPSDETKGPGEEVEIECRADGLPSPTVTWLVNGQPWSDFQANYETGGRWTVTTGQNKKGTIRITGLVTTDSNVFQCLASNKYKELLTSVVLNVVSIPARIPVFEPQSRKLTVLQDDSGTLICNSEGRPTPTISWTFKGSVLTAGDKYSIDDVEGRLDIHNMVEADSGTYVCTVTNSIDGTTHTANDSAKVDVLAKTVISTGPEDIMVEEGQQARFQCEIMYDPDLPSDPTVYWMKSGARLEAAADHSLTVPNAQIESSGTYTCVVETMVDASSGTLQVTNSSAVLTVRGRPSPPENLELNVQENAYHFRLLWDAGNDNNAPITRFVIQQDTEWENMHWTDKAEVAATDNPVYTETLHLDPYVEYAFRIIAYNEIGASDPSEEVETAGKTPPAAPTRNPDNVEGSSTHPDSMVIRWDSIDPYYYGGEDFRYYVKYRVKDSGAQWIEKDVYPPERTLIIDASKAYEAFEFTVQSKNTEGEGPLISTPMDGYSGEASPSTAPQGVTVQVLSASEVNVTWQAINEDDANGVLQGYYVYYNLQTGSGQTRQLCSKSPCIVGDLQAFSTYEISVRAFTNAGEGPSSETMTIETMEAPPGPVTLKVETFSYRLVLKWDEPIESNGNLKGYNIIIAPMTEERTGEDMNITLTLDDPTYLRIEDGIMPDTKYRVEIVAVNGKGPGAITAEEPTTKMRGRPAKPPTAKISDVGPNSANLTWDLSNLNPTAEKVLIEYKKKGDTAEFVRTPSVDILDEDKIMVSGLDMTTDYSVRLRVTNENGATLSETTEFKTTGTSEIVNPGFVMGTWLIILICIIIFLILILLIICIIKSQKGGKYNVSDKEKQLKGDIESTPLKDDGGFDEYKPPTGADGEPLRGSQDSLVDSEHGSSETDSLKEYADGETGKFDEEGSFIGQYGDNKKQRPAEEGEQGGAAYSTFV